MGEIIINEPVLIDRKLIHKLSVSPNLNKFVKNLELFIEYNSEIYADESILNIPLTAAILPLAWLTGTDVYVGTLDSRFHKSMGLLQQEFAKRYPRAPFKTEIHAEKLVENKINITDQNRTGLLFSGGVDSTYSLINNIEHNPRLLMIWGVDNFAFPEHSDHWLKMIKVYKEFSNKQNLSFHIVKTNISQLLNDRKIEHSFHRELYDGSFRFALQHSLVLLPTFAPLSINRFDKLLISSGTTHELVVQAINKPRAARPWADEKIVWANLEVDHHGLIGRHEKVLGIKDYVENNELTLRVCLKSKLIDGNLNDSTCEKCLRTIASLVLAGVDPNECGFKVDKSTFPNMKSFWEKRKTFGVDHTWREISTLIPDQYDFDYYGSKEFFEWFKDFDFKIIEKNWFYTDLYMRLPYRLARLLDTIYKKLDINVHESPTLREKQSVQE